MIASALRSEINGFMKTIGSELHLGRLVQSSSELHLNGSRSQLADMVTNALRTSNSLVILLATKAERLRKASQTTVPLT